VSRRVVFDTSAVVSALLFPAGQLAWLRRHWHESDCLPLVSSPTAAELVRVLAYPKFQLTSADRDELLADYLPWCEVVEVTASCASTCRDPRDQPFLDLAHCGRAQSLVTGDQDLLALAGHTAFAIESPETYRRRMSGDTDPLR